MLAQRTLQGFAGLAINTRADAVEVFDHGHLGAETPPDRAQFQADHPRADHHQMLGHFTQRQRAGGVEDALIVDLDAGQGRGFGAGSDDDVLGAQLGFVALIVGHRDFARAIDVAPAFDPVDLVFAKQKLDAFGQAAHAFVFLFHHLREVERGFDLDAEVGEFRTHGRVVQLRSMQQGLRRHATDVQAGAAEGGAAFHAGCLQAQLAGADRRVITTGAAAQNDHVVVAHAVAPRWGCGSLKVVGR